MPGFVTCGPNEALVISGCCHSKPFLMPGGRVFVWPWLQKIQKISLNTMTLKIESPNVYSNNGVPISLTGISQVKISGNNAERLLSAAENFLGKTEQEIIKIVEETLEGHQREVIAKMTVDKIYKERKEFSKQVYQTASSDLADMGLVVVSYTVKDIHDKEGYLESLGLSQTAKVINDAKKDEIEEFKERKLKELNADKDHYIAKYRNETQISRAQHDFNLKKAEYDISISQEKAKSDLANELQEEIGQKALIKETIQIENENKFNFDDISEKRKEIKKLELKCRVEELADSELQKVKKVADATKIKIEEDCKTEVEIVKLIGEAQAYSLEKISKAQTEVMAKEASAYAEFTSVAKINMLLDVLPKIAAEISEPVSKCNKITMVSQGDGEVGINKIVTEVLDVVTKVYSSVNQLSNVASTGDNLGHPSLLSLEKKISSTQDPRKSTFLGSTFGSSRT